MILRAFDVALGEVDVQVPGKVGGNLPVLVGFSNLTATRDPLPTDDISQSYSAGSLWFNNAAGALRVWSCVNNAKNAAQWAFEGAYYAGGGSNPPAEVTQAGSSTAVMAAEGNINRQIPGVAAAIAPASTGADIVVGVYALPANFFDGLAGTNRTLSAIASGNFAANANTKRIKLWFNATTAVVGSAVVGGTLLADTGAVATNAGGWQVTGTIGKRGAAGSNTQTVISGGAVSGGTHNGVTPCVDTVAVESGQILIAVTINNTTAAGDASMAFFETNAMN
ncbi:hypothetical protein H8A95_15980 [Bradyrhizobium sp. Pear76]|uniref:hypothetical protein n=1 Tax=Bradyrhizobium oropedii TaxID=1571201 RepID=UPI001E4A50BA|nr:hypothetical protein [Bradyrhizobium oropedii]MCC8963770.1 hypothetical protein [Bradyrhizobium oropedii]